MSPTDPFGQLKPGSRIDLHMHSNRSDGAHSPQEVLRRCAAGGLDVIALTDHDLAPDVRPGVHHIEGRDIRVIAGAEISGTHAGREYHLLVYFPGEVPDVFSRFCRRQCQQRATRYANAIEALGAADLAGPDEAAIQGDRAMTRLHLARALVDAGRATHVGDAFNRFLGERHGHVPKLDMPLIDAIELARACGGITSWAHPGIKDVEAHLTTLVAAGLNGIEGLRPKVKSRERARLRKAAAASGIVMTGGSDWHGWAGHKVGLFTITPREIGDFVDLLRAA
jgi:hypothetical protein